MLRDWILFAITLSSCIYAGYCKFRCDAFERGFTTIAKMTYNPKNEKDIREIVNKLNEFIRAEKTNNK